MQVSVPASWGWPGGTVSIHMPAGASGATGTDGEIVVDRRRHRVQFLELRAGPETTTATALSYGEANVATGTGWGTKSPFLSAGIVAAGVQRARRPAGQGRDRRRHDQITRFSSWSTRGLVKSGAVGPAINSDGGSSTGIVQEGELLGIAPGTPMPSGLSPTRAGSFPRLAAIRRLRGGLLAGGSTILRAQANAYDDATTMIGAVGGHEFKLTSAPAAGPSGCGRIEWGRRHGWLDGRQHGRRLDGHRLDRAGDIADCQQRHWGHQRQRESQSSGTVHLKPRLQRSRHRHRNADHRPQRRRHRKIRQRIGEQGQLGVRLHDRSPARTRRILAVSAYNGFSGVKDQSGNSVNLSGAPTWVTNGTLAIDTATPAISSIAASGSGITGGNGTLNSGTVQLTLGFAEAVNVSGTPTLTLNNGGTATYASGAGTKNLVFNYTVGSGQNTPDLAVTAFNLSGVKDQAGNSVSLSGAPTNPPGTLVIGAPTGGSSGGGSTGGGSTGTDTTAPTVSSIAASGSGITDGNGTLTSGTVQLTLGFAEAVNVSGTPTLTLNNGGTATYAGGTGTKNLAFNYTVGTGQNTSDLAVTSYNLSGNL